jgi:hypothetical protein
VLVAASRCNDLGRTVYCLPRVLFFPCTAKVRLGGDAETEDEKLFGVDERLFRVDERLFGVDERLFRVDERLFQ